MKKVDFYDHIHLTDVINLNNLPEFMRSNGFNIFYSKDKSKVSLNFYIGENNTDILKVILDYFDTIFSNDLRKEFRKYCQDIITTENLVDLLYDYPELYILIFSKWAKSCEIHRAIHEGDSQIVHMHIRENKVIEKLVFDHSFSATREEKRNFALHTDHLFTLVNDIDDKFYNFSYSDNIDTPLTISTDANYSLLLVNVKNEICSSSLFKQGFIKKVGSSNNYILKFSPDHNFEIFECIINNLAEFISNEEWQQASNSWKDLANVPFEIKKTALYIYKLVTHNPHIWLWILSNWTDDISITITDFQLDDMEYKNCYVSIWYVKKETKNFIKRYTILSPDHYLAYKRIK